MPNVISYAPAPWETLPARRTVALGIRDCQEFIQLIGTI